MKNIMLAAANFGFQHTKWQICGCCEGHGSVDHPAFSNGFTSQEWADMQNDFDEHDGSTAADRYLRGDYDVLCLVCHGSGKVRVADVSKMSFAQKRGYVRYVREQQDIALAQRQVSQESAAERRMGA
ncbi:hypothetical protein [Herbaspirillum huttiense]|uniref:hypothetical protein n=1 Tax=Herbaspirillum huttiense TaxID=863372 RepID=UPI0039AFE11B